MTFIHPVLTKDCFEIARLPLCHLLLMNDSQYPWCILVPGHENITEIYQLAAEDQRQLMQESSSLGECMMRLFSGHKLNIGVLGNIVPQLHVHHIVRYKNDPAWPGPVWGNSAPRPYSLEKQKETADLILASMQENIEIISHYKSEL